PSQSKSRTQTFTRTAGHTAIFVIAQAGSDGGLVRIALHARIYRIRRSALAPLHSLASLAASFWRINAGCEHYRGGAPGWVLRCGSFIPHFSTHARNDTKRGGTAQECESHRLYSIELTKLFG